MGLVNDLAVSAGKKVYGQAIEHSAVFDGTSDYTMRLSSVEGDRSKFTFSTWFKPSNIAVNQHIIFSVSSTNENKTRIVLLPDGRLQFRHNKAGQLRCSWESNNYFKDETNWYNLVVIVDSSEADLNDRCKMYVNGKRIPGAWSSNMAQGYADFMTGAQNSEYCLGKIWHISGDVYSGYLAESVYLDGITADCTAFGAFSEAVDGLWVPKKYSGEYGVNGFHLNFADGSALGKDVSGNGHNMTVYGSPVQTPDTPTNNYAIIDPHRRWIYGATLSEGNTQVYTSGGGRQAGQSTMSMSTGKWYCEMATDPAEGDNWNVGIIATKNNPNYTDAIQREAGSYLIVNNDEYKNGSLTASAVIPSDIDVGEVAGLAFDADAGTLMIYINGVHQHTITGIPHNEYTFVGGDAGDSYALKDVRFRFREDLWQYAPPEGYKALCSQNLTDPKTIDPAKGVDIVLRSGTGADATVSGLGFAPDFILTKARDVSYSWNLFDTTRGSSKVLFTNKSNAEATHNDRLLSFNSDGFTVGSGGGTNDSGRDYINFCLKSSPEFGFDIVKYTGDGVAGRQIAHNCGGVPEMIWVKCLSNNFNWAVYHKDVGPQYYLVLNSSSGDINSGTVWNDTSPDSSSFTAGVAGLTNNNGEEYIAYIFRSVPGFSKVFSYEGNGSADGPFVDLGFTPFAMMMKNTDASEHWRFYDSVRDPCNPADKLLQPNIDNVEGVGHNFQFHTNGMKVVSPYSSVNSNGHKMVGIAWAAHPLKYSNAF
ncbi:DUF7483 domain-containing protein [Desulfovibrio oxyclinae]|uniref:DUF7483 domain-containing protein n=1 Tax=Desulfovibrio oxyclinae TaxID=63560 RepID=UPI00035DC6E2|nr:LamG-like jellyroll fold domain-containing protein [Desulfovibrio oxyclinae]